MIIGKHSWGSGHSKEEPGKLRRTQASRVVEKVDKLVKKLAYVETERLLDTLFKSLPKLEVKRLVITLTDKLKEVGGVETLSCLYNDKRGG